MNNTPPLVTVDQSSKIRSLSLNVIELRKLLDVLQERANTAADIEILHFEKREQNDQQYAANKKIIKDGFGLYLTITGKNGVKLTGNIETVFESPNFPDEVVSVFFDSSFPLRHTQNYHVRNKCVLFLDFTRPAVLNFSLMPSHETPNESNVAVQGLDATWVHGLYHEVERYISDHPSTSRILHRHTTYDLIVWTLGYPLGFWVCFRCSPLIAKATTSPFICAALYTYLFLICLVCFRILFHYARWIWPLVEFREPKNHSIKHKVIWSAIALSVISSLLYDLLKAIFIH